MNSINIDTNFGENNNKESLNFISKEVDKLIETEEFNDKYNLLNLDYNKKTLYQEPLIFTIDKFLSNEECEHMKNLAKGNFKPSLVSGNDKGYVSTGRTGMNFWINHEKDKVTKLIGDKIANIIGIPLINAEAYQMIYYGKSQEYKQHYDGWILDGSDKSRRNMKYGGQRIATALCYLNDVESGGGTCFPRLNIEVTAEKGKLLVFHNVFKNTNNRHPLSEHAGMPVIEGDKWAFNLWFREEARTKLYDYKVDSKFVNNKISRNIENPNISKTLPDNHIENISNKNLVYRLLNFINTFEKDLILSKCNFTNEDRSIKWIKNEEIPFLIERIEKTININRDYFENMCLIKYNSNKSHNNHLDAYDLDTEKGKKYTLKSGQRLFTITGILKKNPIYEFSKININQKCDEGSVIIYRNNHLNSLNRNDKLTKKIIINESETILFHIYIRQKCKHSTRNDLKLDLPLFADKINNSAINSECSYKNKLENLQNQKLINYNDILDDFYNKINDNQNLKNGYKELKFNGKVPWEIITDNIKELYILRKNNSNSILNKKNFENRYNIDEFTPLVIEDVYLAEASKIFIDYFRKNINEGKFELGDKQSKRYKAYNESLNRIMHYEILPLIEHIVKCKLQPTYTYLSCYTKNCDLPAHTDRSDCEYTVSYIIDKPDNFKWNIYVDKNKQPVKGKGRYDYTPEKSDCIAVDCNRNGLMIFQGEDHIHYRDKLNADYYNIVLLHFKKIF